MSRYSSALINYSLLAALALFLFAACSSSKSGVVMVNEAPVSSSKPDTTEINQPTGAGFQEITIGENQPIHSLDPLFIRNSSEMRAVQLVFEGLVRYNAQGQIVPGAARRWAVSHNHRKFQFILKHNLFYQDSNIFANGRGRRVKPQDVKSDFVRMAAADVPQTAAHIFMNIQGFEPYFQEQHHVFRSTERQLHGISGIKIPNDSTIVFTLVQSDEHFLQKLASPYAVIYPSKAAKTNSFTAVGIGPFKLAQQRSDSLYIFGRFSHYQGPQQPLLNRVNMITRKNPIVLLKALKHGSIDLIPELGPKQVKIISNANGALKKAFSTKFRLLNYPKTESYELLYYKGAKQPESAVTEALHLVLGHMKHLFESRNISANTSSHQAADSITSTYSYNPFIRFIYSKLSDRLAGHNILFKMSQSRTVNRNIALSMHRKMPFVKDLSEKHNKTALAVFEFTPKALVGSNVHHFNLNEYPWQLDLRNVTVSSNPNR